MELLSVKDLSFQREGYFAFKHVAFSLYQKESIFILGDNGSGKTQLLETLVSLNSPDIGQVEITPKARIGYLSQIDPQVISLSVRKYLERNRALSGDLAVQDSQLKDLTAYMGMSPYLDRPVKQLSLGLRQRVGFLAAVVIRPNILILDEPFSFQNGRHISNMLDIIQDLKNHDAGVILASATQDNSALKLFDKTYLLKNKNLSKLNSNKNGDSCILIFNIKNDSMAITKDLKNYLLTNVNNVIELKVPTIIKDSVIKEMISLNYNFEGARIIEN